MEKSMVEFSIIIPVFNTELYIVECIESVLAQSFQSFEIILIDDGSTDGSPDICDTYAENPRIRCIHKENEGPSIARNIGVEISLGRYIMFLDSDDFITDSDVLSKFRQIFNDTETDIIYCKYDGFVDENYYDCKYEIHPKNLRISDNDIEGMNVEEVVLTLFKVSNYYSSPTIKIFCKKFYVREKLSFHEKIINEDEEWTPRLLLSSSKIRIYKDSFYGRRIREGSIMTSDASNHCLKRIRDMVIIAMNMINYTSSKCHNIELKHVYHEYFADFLWICNRLKEKLDVGEREEAQVYCDKLEDFLGSHT